MLSERHEVLVELFRDRPTLAVELLRVALNVDVSPDTPARIESAAFNEINLPERHADLVVLLDDGPVGGIIVEVQLSTDSQKRFSWPVYVTALRARQKRPVYLLVVTPEATVARWAATPIDLGAGNAFTPLVLGPSGFPEVTDAETACAVPELAVLSAVAHGRDADTEKALRIAQAAVTAVVQLDDPRGKVYGELVLASLSEAARRELETMDLAKYKPLSELARRWLAQGQSEGRQEGRAVLIVHQLSRRFGPLDPKIEAQVSAASIEELEAIGERLLTARTLREALDGD